MAKYWNSDAKTGVLKEEIEASDWSEVDRPLDRIAREMASFYPFAVSLFLFFFFFSLFRL
jgi:hypothetical protein